VSPEQAKKALKALATEDLLYSIHGEVCARDGAYARLAELCGVFGSQRSGLNEFHAANVARQHEAFAPAHSLTALVVCVQEEVGELAAAVLGVTGEKKRKAHLTKADVLDAVADAMTYLSLVASTVGCEDLEKLLGDTFNMVSKRAGSAITTTLGRDS
jgi:NTP pyrophosphatase (non-canonical NTP hydrolase)